MSNNCSYKQNQTVIRCINPPNGECSIHGEIVEEEPRTFSFIEPEVDYPEGKVVKKVIFDRSRYGEFTKILTFKKLRTAKSAVKKVEKWLSQPATWEYYQEIKDDLYRDDYGVEDFQNGAILKGDLLTDCVFLENAILKEDVLYLSCGS